ncbi:hypothetical protein B296_00044737, partial [Ensete ventricosum]
AGMTSSDSSSSVRVVSSPGSGGTDLGDPKASPSGASSGPPSPVDARVLRDLEVMKADHDLDTAMIEGSLAVIRERYNISIEYGLHVRRSRQRPYSSDAPGVCILVDALEAGLRFPLHPLIEECIRWWRISPNQVALNSWRYLVVFLGKRRGTEIIPTWGLFMACFRLCKSRGDYYLTAYRMDLGDLRGMPKVSRGKAPAPKSSFKRPSGSLVSSDDPSRRHKKVKILSGRHKSCRGKEGSRSHSKGKEPAEPVEEPEMLGESAEEDASSVFHRPRSMKDLFKTKVHKDDAGYYALHMSDLAHQDPDKEMQPRWEGLKNSTKIWNDPSAIEEFERGLLHPQLARELYTLPSEVLLARAAKEMVLSVDFKEALKRTSRVTYEYSYRVTLARFRSLHPDSEVEEDPFTIKPEDDSVPMERQ